MIVEVLTAAGVVLAGVVAIVREWRMARREQNEHLREMRLMEESRFEQTARRDQKERKRRASEAPGLRKSPHVPTGEFDDEPTSNIYEIREEMRRELERPRGLREPRRGTHHDKER